MVILVAGHEEVNSRLLELTNILDMMHALNTLEDYKELEGEETHRQIEAECCALVEVGLSSGGEVGQNMVVSKRAMLIWVVLLGLKRKVSWACVEIGLWKQNSLLD